MYGPIKLHRIQSTDKATGANHLNISIPVLLKRDIAGSCSPGDVVHLVAFVRQRWKRLRRGERLDIEIFLDALDIQVLNLGRKSHLYVLDDTKGNLSLHAKIAPAASYRSFWQRHGKDEIMARAQIVDAIDCGLLGLDNSKLALLLTAIGGCLNPQDVPTPSGTSVTNKWSKYSRANSCHSGTECSASDWDQSTQPKSQLSQPKSHRMKSSAAYGGPPTRTNCHVLFLGSPGTGKSQLLKYASNLTGRYVAVSGTNCSTAGLTCTLIREGSETMLGVGALVLADGGICCIDEFVLIPAEDKACLHEAMEQQNISIAKAGIKCSLRCRCTIIAASNFSSVKNSNFSSQYDSCMVLVDDPLPLLSRFDLIIVLKECPLSDLELSNFLLEETINNGNDFKPKPKSQHPTNACDTIDWSVGQTLRDYIHYIKTHIMPTLSESAKTILNAYYTQLRQVASTCKNGGGPTVRTLESLIRLSQAHARLLFRNLVDVLDVVSVIWLYEFGLSGCTVGSSLGNEQAIERFGLFPHIVSIFQDYAGAAGGGLKFGNGIVNVKMYRYFESLLLNQLGLAKGPNGVAPAI
ncbi:bifunctional MCM domain/P-loop containing nucleoside triphosphate hydrolase/Nucleic acid-binding [Babesia duncani]|uniref:Bifunctional MCM domain/P-loop containing nucleoside triphosphate hydrolase/Nucleic acid-binding n=1 Tax=Babesia duncani TaxID=323732 RepID=A0AAD9PP92_9APIC|nr:bifunctional MCM domain/P-loop containing nucleoside triphosphate hydrolase/Nucleic acid-binding [Babesia duncani]